MGLSGYLQSPEILKSVYGKSPVELRSLLLKKGLQWYASHVQEQERIAHNLTHFGFTCSEDLVERVKEHIILHYYEKVLPLCGDPAWYHDFLRQNVELGEIGAIEKSIKDGRGVLVATAHFGAVELIVPCLSMFRIPVHPVLRFTTEQFSKIAHQHAQNMEKSGLFGHIHFIEIGKAGTAAALDMAAVLRKKEVLTSVFDEKTEYSIPVRLFGRQVYGGAGLDRLLKFANTPVALFNAFMIRTGVNRYRLKLVDVAKNAPDPVIEMFRNLEQVVGDAVEQWYFLHEEIPFAGE